MPKRRIPVKQKLRALKGRAEAVAMRARWLAGRKKPRTQEELSKLPLEKLFEETLFELREHTLTAEEIKRVLPELRSQLQGTYLEPASEKRDKKSSELDALIKRLDAELKRLNVPQK